MIPLVCRHHTCTCHVDLVEVEKMYTIPFFPKDREILKRSLVSSLWRDQVVGESNNATTDDHVCCECYITVFPFSCHFIGTFPISQSKTGQCHFHSLLSQNVLTLVFFVLCIIRGFPTRMVYLKHDIYLRYTILVGNAQYACWPRHTHGLKPSTHLSTRPVFANVWKRKSIPLKTLTHIQYEYLVL